MLKLGTRCGKFENSARNTQLEIKKTNKQIKKTLPFLIRKHTYCEKKLVDKLKNKENYRVLLLYIHSSAQLALSALVAVRSSLHTVKIVRLAQIKWVELVFRQ